MIAAFIMAATLAAADTPAAEPPVLTREDVAVRSKPPEGVRIYPEKAEALEVEGEASVVCMITQQGRLTDCAALSETPTGYGFAATAQTIAQVLLKVAKTTKDGAPTAGRRFRFDMAFRLPKV